MGVLVLLLVGVEVNHVPVGVEVKVGLLVGVPVEVVVEVGVQVEVKVQVLVFVGVKVKVGLLVNVGVLVIVGVYQVPVGVGVEEIVLVGVALGKGVPEDGQPEAYMEYRFPFPP